MRRDVALAHEAVDVQTFLNLEVEPRLRRLRRGSCRCPQPPRGDDNGRGRLQHGCCPHDLETIHEELLNTCCVLAGIAVGEAANAPVEAEARPRCQRRLMLPVAGASMGATYGQHEL